MRRSDRRMPYARKELTARRPQREFTGDSLREIAFPLGGIGTGCISLGGRGDLRDWEIFNRPNQGYRPEFTFVTLRAAAKGAEPVTRVIESPLPPPYSGPFGTARSNGEGFPHMASNTFRGEYPFAWLDFADAAMPLRVSLHAFNPFIPLNERDSGLPVAILTYRLTNVSRKPVRALLVATCENMVGYGGVGRRNPADLGKNRTRYRERGGLRGLVMDSLKYPADHPRFGTIVVATPWKSVTYSGNVGDGQGFDTGHRFWDEVHRRGRLEDKDAAKPTPDGKTTVCALGARLRLKPGQSTDVPILLAWHFPNYQWGQRRGAGGSEEPPKWKNYYATQWADAWEAAAYVHKNLARLRRETEEYHGALFGSTLPIQVLDAASSQTSTLKTCTCLRLEDGTFYGFEGCGKDSGCCHGSCTHVWNYQQALPFLFPALERSMRTADYTYNLRESDGRMCFRIGLPLGTSNWDFHAAADGQLGGVIKTYRDWLLCGDDDWLRALWPRVKKALSYAWVEWDADRDGVAEGIQHNTYDIELRGPNPLVACFYLGALRAAEEMARHLGEDDQAADYRALFEKGSAKTDRLLFNGEYYIQRYDPRTVKTMQFGDGCLSDQMLGQWLSAICDLGYLLEPGNVRSALESVFRQNWRPDLREHANPQRVYAVGDEAGLLMCSWPRGGRPLIPTLYCDEVWTGIEYQAASHLIMEGMVEEGLAVVKGARDRHDGRRRNPWDEPECGSHYARAMSSWGLVLALSGFFANASAGLMRFAPRLNAEDFRCIWSMGSGWGTFAQQLGRRQARAQLMLLGGRLGLRALQLRLPGASAPQGASARVKGRSVPCRPRTEDGWTTIRFPRGVSLRRGDQLDLAVRR